MTFNKPKWKLSIISPNGDMKYSNAKKRIDWISNFYGPFLTDLVEFVIYTLHVCYVHMTVIIEIQTVL